MPASGEAVDTTVLKDSRQACHKARDAFFACVEGVGLEFTSDLPVPSRCSRTRAAYEHACRDSWVAHFDTLHDKETKFYRRKRAFEEQQWVKAQQALQQQQAAGQDKGAAAS